VTQEPESQSSFPPPYGGRYEHQPPPPQGSKPRAGGLAHWSVGDTVIGVAMVIGLLFLGGIPVYLLAGDSGLDATIGSQVVLEAALLATALFFAARDVSLDKASAALGLRRPVVPWVGTTLLALLAYLGFAVIFASLVADPEQVDVADELGFDQSTLGAISAGILIVIVAPLAEEVFFRGFFFGGLRARMPFVWAALISGAFFGSIHLTTGNLAVGVQLSVLGIVLAYLYERSGSLWSPIALHTINNGLAFLVLVST
jgi:membrane protease YdiL (CAAX protease family)